MYWQSFKLLALTNNHVGGFFKVSEENHKILSDKAVCRIDLATPGLYQNTIGNYGLTHRDPGP